MSTDTGPGEGGDDRSMEKIDVRVPAAMLQGIDDEYPRRGYPSRSEAVRDALRDWLNPSPGLSEEILDELQASREHGETVSVAEARERLALDDTDGDDSGGTGGGG